jgi:hypothetical protein
MIFLDVYEEWKRFGAILSYIKLFSTLNPKGGVGPQLYSFMSSSPRTPREAKVLSKNPQ